MRRQDNCYRVETSSLRDGAATFRIRIARESSKHTMNTVLPMEKTVLVAGYSGLIGTFLVRALEAGAMRPIRLIRSTSPGSGPGERSASGTEGFFWNPAESPPLGDLSRLPPIHAAVHLSGANIAGHRWSPAYKAVLRESRVGTTRALLQVLAGLRQPPRVLICASAVGIYGDRGSEILTEDSPPGAGFLPELCQEWEAAAQPAAAMGIRVVHLRLGLVLDRSGGVLARLLPLFRLGLGGKLGSGRQWMSWVALPDVTRAILFAIGNEQVRGAVNGTAPNPVTNEDFTRALAHALHRPAIFPVPAAALRLAFGQMARETMLASARVLPERLTAAGFRFEHEEIGPALGALLRP